MIHGDRDDSHVGAIGCRHSPEEQVENWLGILHGLCVTPDLSPPLQASVAGLLG